MSLLTCARLAGTAMLLTAGLTGLAGTTYKVWTNGVPAAPYDTWETAFTNIQNAVDYAAPGDAVLVTNGVYTVGQTLRLAKFVTVQSAQGPEATAISLLRPAVTATVVSVTFSNAVLDGFTVRDGSNSPAGNGGGVFVALTGTVQNCIITSNYAGNGAGAYVSSNGIVRNCRILNNTYSSAGGGVYLLAGTVEGCEIISNIHIGGSAGYGSGLYQINAAAITRNGLIRKNAATRGGGGVWINNGLLENCTVVENTMQAGYQGGGIVQQGGTVRNTIVWHNANVWYQFPNWYKTGGTAEYCSTEDALAGAGNTTAQARFVNVQAGNFRLAPDSPCRNTGTNLAWMSGASDLAGQLRAQGVPDMGCYEFTTGPLQCGFWPDKRTGFDPCEVVFQASADGTNTGSLYYRWDFDNNGTVDAEGAGAQTVTNTYGNGYWTPALTLSNAAGETATLALPNLLRVGPQTIYVAAPPGASPAPPFTNWTAAATNIMQAVNLGVDGSTVWVTNGTYSNQTIHLTNGITVRSVGGAAVTVIKAPALFPSFSIGNANQADMGYNPGAVIRGFTLTRNTAPDTSGPYLYGGALVDCVISNFKGDAISALRLDHGALAYNCLIVSNIMQRGGMCTVSGIQQFYGRTSMVDRCVFRKNLQTTECWASSSYTSAVVGVSIYPGGLVRNSLFEDNVNANNKGTVAWMSGGVLESCTIVNNRAGNPVNGASGGVFFNTTNPVVRNCVFLGNSNWVTGATADFFTGWITGRVEHCRLTPLPPGPGNITGDPLLLDAALGDFHLAAGSPCFNTGTNQGWMLDALDLDGDSRLRGKTVDMGCYEAELPRSGSLMLIR